MSIGYIAIRPFAPTYFLQPYIHHLHQGRNQVMTSSAMPQQPGAQQPGAQQPDVSNERPKSRRRERSQPTLWAIAGVFFVLGAAATALTTWQLHKLYVATVAPPVNVEGVLRAQYEYETVEGLNPPPSGYYIAGTGVDRFYLTGVPLQGYVGKAVVASGSVSGICGPKSIPCYPILQVREVEYHTGK